MLQLRQIGGSKSLVRLSRILGTLMVSSTCYLMMVGSARPQIDEALELSEYYASAAISLAIATS